ncbi:sugar ABC transporter substrate-binding protein [Aeromicrobium chenweiae]|uniref:Sugar ABC transporter substrate-binding protein n=1 Tax=Aeromicrobium chenweiae TaxID=2079793 RepID=A0A2S0WLF1_9ACTN|nr:substrate-binding domain-containing protein [Aeromicrobium chenweiae]AWB92090.1 sugar ABC transporter substrate-binding protein [Aeromicrobium chenweiae]TGN32938.1 sugar ABC transporter substrate-binding protein [Aeromicrobium chenweiae]
MKRTRNLMLATVMGATLALSACGGSDSDGNGGGSGGGSDKVGKVGIILPDTVSSVRWETADRPALEKAFKDAGVTAYIQNARGDADQMAKIAQSLISKKISVLAIVNLDNKSGAAIEKKAAAAGVKTIDYDRLTLGGNADFYVSYDNTKVGELQGAGLQKCLGDKKANIAFLNGSPDDSNATLFSKGAHNVLDKDSNYTKVAEQAVQKWDPTTATTVFQQMFTKEGGKIDGVLAANDGLAGSAISVLQKNNVAGKVPVTGQDATVEGLQRILAGTQCMTVYKSAKAEAGAVAKLAIALAKGEKGSAEQTSRDDEGNRDVPSVLLDPVSVDKSNVKDVIADGGAAKEDVCKGFAKECADAGIS